MKYMIALLITLLLTSCSVAETQTQSHAPILGTSTIPIMPPSVTRTAAEPPFPTLTPAALVITPPAIEEISWATYEFQVGVFFDYPSDWFINSISLKEDYVEFMFPYSPYNLSARVFDLPENDRAMTDPHSWGLNEGGYEILWEKLISIQDADELEFIWGVPTDNAVDGWLTAIYYSEKHGLMLRLDSFADTIPTESNKYNIIEHMVQSVRIRPQP